MDSEERRQDEAARVMAVCFDKQSPTKSQSGIPKSRLPKNA
jgi:hypothetical protein